MSTQPLLVRPPAICTVAAGAAIVSVAAVSERVSEWIAAALFNATVSAPATAIMTSLAAFGTAPPLQSAAVFQLPLTALFQLTGAGEVMSRLSLMSPPRL